MNILQGVKIGQGLTMHQLFCSICLCECSYSVVGESWKGVWFSPLLPRAKFESLHPKLQTWKFKLNCYVALEVVKFYRQFTFSFSSFKGIQKCALKGLNTLSPSSSMLQCPEGLSLVCILRAQLIYTNRIWLCLICWFSCYFLWKDVVSQRIIYAYPITSAAGKDSNPDLLCASICSINVNEFTLVQFMFE